MIGNNREIMSSEDYLDRDSRHHFRNASISIYCDSQDREKRAFLGGRTCCAFIFCNIFERQIIKIGTHSIQRFMILLSNGRVDYFLKRGPGLKGNTI